MIKRTELATMVRGWWQDEDGFGLNGYRPGFIEEWWKDRLAKGALEGPFESARLTDHASSALLQRLKAMRVVA